MVEIQATFTNYYMQTSKNL